MQPLSQAQLARAAHQNGDLEFRRLLDVLPAAAYTCDATGRINYFNQRAVEIWGRTPRLNDPQELYCGSYRLHSLNGSLVPHDVCGMAIALHTGQSFNGFEIVIERPDGSRRVVSANPAPLLDESGAIVGAMNVLVDITEKKEAEQLLRRREQELADFLDNATIGFHSVDADGTILRANQAELELVGYASEEYLGRNITEFHVDQDVIADIIRRLKAGEEIHEQEARLRCKDGSIKYVLINSNVLWENGEFVHTRCFTRDVTDRKRAEEALQRQSERLQLLWESASLLLAADDPNAMVQSVLAKISPHLGADAYLNYVVSDAGDELLLTAYSGIPSDRAAQIARLAFGEAICGTSALRREPVVVSHIQESSDPKFQAAKSLGFRAFACNPLISEQALLGTLSFASRSKDRFEPDELTFLGTICHHLTLAYERMRLMNRLQEADRRKDEFLATLAHELRNPLAPVRNAVQVLQMRSVEDPDLRWSRDVIERQVEHLTRLIDDLLDLSRITRNRLELRPQRVSLADVIQGAVEASRPNIDSHGHELAVMLPTTPVYLHADVVRLSQVFLNLLNNAAKYTERGGRICLTAEAQDGEVVVSVKDNGVGIPASTLHHLFEMFFQVDRSLERSQGGLGIGLSLVKHLVQLHGGKVEAHSEGIGKGSEFIVRLPVLVDDTMSHQGRDSGSEPQVAASTSRRILVVDDNRDAADSLAMLLRLTGNEVQAAYDGVDGIETAQRFRPDVVLLDIGMPRMNGYDACRQMRSNDWGRDALLIALTGWGQEEDRWRTVEAGFDAHLVKPLDPTALIRLLGTLPVRTRTT